MHPVRLCSFTIPDPSAVQLPFPDRIRARGVAFPAGLPALCRVLVLRAPCPRGSPALPPLTPAPKLDAACAVIYTVGSDGCLWTTAKSSIAEFVWEGSTCSNVALTCLAQFQTVRYTSKSPACSHNPYLWAKLQRKEFANSGVAPVEAVT